MRKPEISQPRKKETERKGARKIKSIFQQKKNLHNIYTDREMKWNVKLRKKQVFTFSSFPQKKKFTTTGKPPEDMHTYMRTHWKKSNLYSDFFFIQRYKL